MPFTRVPASLHNCPNFYSHTHTSLSFLTLSYSILPIPLVVSILLKIDTQLGVLDFTKNRCLVHNYRTSAVQRYLRFQHLSDLPRSLFQKKGNVTGQRHKGRQLCYSILRSKSYLAQKNVKTFRPDMPLSLETCTFSRSPCGAKEKFKNHF